jgi:hypothetical protein
MERVRGFEPLSSRWQREILTIILYPHLAVSTGFEPATFSLTGSCSTIELGNNNCNKAHKLNHQF